MRVYRNLLVQGNGKLGQSIASWSLPAVSTCPGSTDRCRRVCYAQVGRFRFHAVQERLAWNEAQSQRNDFVSRMVKEIRRKGCLVIRVHVAGDFYDADYTEKWLAIIRRSPKTRVYFYTRSWRIPSIAPVLTRIASLTNARVWFSIDAETGRPETVPPRVRLAYLQADTQEVLGPMDLLFRVRELRRQRIPLSVLCPHEAPHGPSKGVNCANCQRCWQ